MNKIDIKNPKSLINKFQKKIKKVIQFEFLFKQKKKSKELISNAFSIL